MDIVERMKEGQKIVIGMVHCRALPGTRNYDGAMDEVIRCAVADAKALQAGGVDAIMVENGNDAPSAVKLDTAQVAALAAVAQAVSAAVSIPFGVDAAFNDCQAGIAICEAAGGQFIRCPVFVDTVVSGVGLMQPCNREAVTYRKALGALQVKILADIQVKHSYMLDPDIPIETSAAWAESRGADALIVTGSQTGEETPLEMIRRVKKAARIPVLAGSGVTAENAREQFAVLDGAIVGSYFKQDGKYQNPVDADRVAKLMEMIR